MRAAPSRAARQIVALAPVAWLALASAAVLRASPPIPSPGPTRPVPDARGRAVPLALPFRGIAFLGPGLSDYLLATDAPESLVATTGGVLLTFGQDLASRFFPSVWRLPRVSQAFRAPPDIERLLAIRPSLVIGPRPEALRRYGLCAVAAANSFHQSDLIATTRTYTAAVGASERGADLLARFAAAQAALRNALDRLPTRPVPRVLILYEDSTGGLWSNGRHFPGSEVIAQAGGVNALAPLASPGVSLDPERVLRVDPDTVLQVRSLTFSASNPVASDPRLRTLRAVRTHQVFWTAPALNWAESVVETPAYTRSLAEDLHPALPHAAGQMLREAYAHALGVTLSDAVVADALSVTLNGGRGG